MRAFLVFLEGAAEAKPPLIGACEPARDPHLQRGDVITRVALGEGAGEVVGVRGRGEDAGCDDRQEDQPQNLVLPVLEVTHA